MDAVRTPSIFDRFEAPPSAKLLGWTLRAIDPDAGTIEIGFSADDRFTNPGGTVVLVTVDVVTTVEVVVWARAAPAKATTTHPTSQARSPIETICVRMLVAPRGRPTGIDSGLSRKK